MSDHEADHEAAKLFGSYLENYGDHHEWCGASGVSWRGEACECGYFAALGAVAAWHAEAKQASTS